MATCLVALGSVVGGLLITDAADGRGTSVDRTLDARGQTPPADSDETAGEAAPAHLASTGTTPVDPSDPGRLSSAVARSTGRLLVPRLGIAARVVAVGWSGQAMAVPDDPAVLGWFEPTAAPGDRAGVSLVAGHVSDRRDRPGPLARLLGARIGDAIVWQVGRAVARFWVRAIERYPRARGLPRALFAVDGPHLLRLVTCADRRSGLFGFHYADNLVISAAEIAP